ncbi:MAG TPA: haloacid dehalogenase-like hydrolase [Ignavibacteriaceae bacterium]|nr:haloacid dehalogenase-like hydrolase [Ignavibacteriaceae bacterium]
MDNRENIVVVDLDNTLLNVDSFNLLLTVQLKKSFIKVMFLRVLRKLRILNPASYKYYVVRYIYNCLSNAEKHSFVEKLSLHLNEDLFHEINSKYKNDCQIMILSASPDEYVKPFANKLGWHGFGSYYDQLLGKYFHLHSKGKREFILEHFPKDKFNYVYAISDSKTDLDLLKHFNKYNLFSTLTLSNTDNL